MRIYDNGIYRDMTQEEIAELEVFNANNDIPIETPKTTEERLAELEQALTMLLEGALE